MSDGSALQALQPLKGTAIAFIILNTIFICLRFYTVRCLRAKRLPLTWDDWYLIPAYLSVLAICIMGFLMHHYEGEGNPPYGADEPILIHDRLEPVLKCIFGILIVLSSGYAFTRYSILAFYLRVFTGKWTRMVSYFFIFFITAQWISFTFATIFQCTPVSYYWNRTIPGGHCFDVDRFNKSFTPVNIAADSVILIMPLPVIWRLEASTLRKAGYTIILGLGSFALAASIVRAVVLDQNTTIIITPTLSNLEITWLIIEPSLYLITACLPTMQPLLRLMAPASVRRATEDKIAKSRHGKALPFARLGDDDSKRHFASFGSASTMPESKVGASASSRGSQRTPSVNDNRIDPAPVPMQDLAQLESMKGIIVHTEITVTQEERMEDVMGF